MASEDGGADSDAGEQTNTRFPCLATVRTLVATVVTVLAVVVVLMVIFAVERPEKIVLYIDSDYIQAEQLWWKERQQAPAPAPAPAPTPSKVALVSFLPCAILQRRQQGGRDDRDFLIDHGVLPVPGDDDDCEDGGTIPEYDPVKKVELSVSVDAYNPSGRGKTIVCNITAIRVLDMTSSYTGVAIASLVPPPDKPIRSPVPPQSSHSKRRTITINDTDALHYLYQRYQQISSFTAMVQLDIAFSEKIGNISVYCYPVTVGYGGTYADEDTSACKTSKEMVGYNISWYPPPKATRTG